jgi:hypothetical protein
MHFVRVFFVDMTGVIWAYHQNDKFREDEIGRACSTYVTEDECI